MQHIDPAKLYADGSYRFEYVSKFMDFGKCVFVGLYMNKGINVSIHRR